MTRPAVTTLASPLPRVMSVGTAHPSNRYSQEELADLLAISKGTIDRRFFTSSGIEGRYLYMQPTAEGQIADESQSDLLRRHRQGSLELGRQAIARSLEPLGLTTADIDYLCCVTSTGFMMPGVSGMFVRHLGFRPSCHRVDIVGMGCHAAVNGLNAAACWAVANPGRVAIVVCCEINSAIHVRDDRVVTSLVNSLFGDGCGAMVVSAGADASCGPEVLGFASHLVSDAWCAISYHWSERHGRFELYLDKAIPQVLGDHSPTPITALLERFDLCRCSVAHWLIHAGGKKVIAAIGEANRLTSHDLRTSTSVLKEYGNVGSPTILFSYQELMKEGVVAPGDYGVMVTMGPGSTIETALLRW
jgi:3,5-dihydroxyphenylacetyl-CoA synthase